MKEKLKLNELPDSDKERLMCYFKELVEDGSDGFEASVITNEGNLFNVVVEVECFFERKADEEDKTKVERMRNNDRL
jgi:hypothetical protein